MDTHSFDLTPEQKSLLVTLARETGKPIPALLAEALAALQEHTGRGRARDEETPPHATPTPSVLAIFQEARAGIPDETWTSLPQDLAAQHDHYIYGTPKHP